jgi:hypothetical protein
MAKRDRHPTCLIKKPDGSPVIAAAYRRLSIAVLQQYLSDNLDGPHPRPDHFELLCELAEIDAEAYLNHCRFIYGPDLPFRRVESPRELPRALIKKAPSR